MNVHTLFLDLASNSQLIALVQDERTVGLMKIESKTGEEQLLPFIEGLLTKANITFKDLNRIASTTGPGGFMSLRVGISLANALSDSLGIPLAGVHLSEAWRERVARNQWLVGRILWVHSTKREALFVREYEESAKNWLKPTLIKVSELQSATALTTDHLPLITSYVGELIDSQQAALPKLQKMEKLMSIEEVLPTLLATLKYEMKPLEPWYGRGA